MPQGTLQISILAKMPGVLVVGGQLSELSGSCCQGTNSRIAKKLIFSWTWETFIFLPPPVFFYFDPLPLLWRWNQSEWKPTWIELPLLFNSLSSFSVKIRLFDQFSWISSSFVLSQTRSKNLNWIFPEKDSENVVPTLFKISSKVGGLRSTEEAFLLPTQQPWVWIPAVTRFFSLLLSLGADRTHLVLNAVSSDVQFYLNNFLKIFHNFFKLKFNKGVCLGNMLLFWP